MAGALITTSVRIGSTTIRQFSSFTLSQGIFAHHQFRMACPAETIEGLQGSLFAQSKNLIGETITVNLQDTDGLNGSLLFSGVVTQVESARFAGHTGDVVITGFAPTVVLDNGPHCNTWEKKALNNIANDVLGHFATHIKSPVVNATYGETFAYTVQYKETAWQFLSRLAGTYGEWFFYNGQALVFGQPKGKTATLIFGRDLSRFNIALELRPPNFQQMARDYVNDQLYDTTPSGIESKAGLNELGKHVYAKSKSFFSTQPKSWNNRFLTNKKQLEDTTNFRAAAQSSNMIKFYGSSTHQGVQLGNKISVKGQNILSANDEAYGEYSVIEVTHHFNSQGEYSNDFVAIPATVKIPPITGVAEPTIETQSAFVTDNHDPQGMGRIRVKLHWMKGSQKTPWIRVTSPHGGGGKGMFFIPELGEEVIVGFEGDSPVKPYVIGTVYHGKANSTFSNGGNDVKALQTRSGNKIVMNDKDGSVTVADPSGNTVIMHGNGEITIKAPTKMLITSPDIFIVAQNSISMNVGGSEQAPAPTASFVLDNASQSAAMNAKQTIHCMSEQDMTLIGINTLQASTQELSMSGSTTATVVAGQMHLDGGAMARISSADTDII